MKLNAIRAIMALSLLISASGIHGQVRPLDGALDTQAFFSPNGYGLLYFPAPPRISVSTTSVINDDYDSNVVITPDDRLIIASASTVTELPSKAFTSRIVVSKQMGDGSLDRSFGAGTGYSTINLSSTAPKTIGGVKLTRATVGGKILIAVHEFNDIWLNQLARTVFVRLNSDGSLDSTYGPMQNGVATLPASFMLGSFEILPDDAVVVTGGARRAPPNSDMADMAVVKLTSNGLVDTAFAPTSSDHIARVEMKQDVNRYSIGLSIAINPNNQHILVTGQSIIDRVGYRLVPIASFTADGNVDTDFGDYPDPMRPFGPRSGLALVGDLCGALNDDVLAFGASVVVQPDGKVAVVGLITAVSSRTNDPDSCSSTLNLVDRYVPYVLRLNADGSLDTGFKLNKFGAGNFLLDYYVSRPRGNGALYNGNRLKIVRQWDGKLVIGSVDNSVTPGVVRLTRLNTDGSMDNTFLNNTIQKYGVGLYPLGNDGAPNVLTDLAMEGYGIVGVGRHGDRPVVFRVLGNASEISY